MTDDLEPRSAIAAAVYARHRAIFNAKLCVTGALGWLCAWLFIPGAFTVWLGLVGVYSVLLGAYSIAASLGYRGSVAQREWQGNFFRVSGWLVMSGVVSFGLVLLVVLVRVLAGVGS